MMKTHIKTLGIFLFVIQKTNAQFGPALRSGPITTGAWIQEAFATLLIGGTPTPVTGDVALWTGMLTDKNDFIQAIAEHSSPTGGYIASSLFHVVEIKR